MSQTILLVDDNAIQATTRRAILQRTGRTVIVANGAPQALAMLDDPAFLKSIGLVMTDHLMPEMNGPEFVAALRKRMPNAPVVVLSGFLDVEPEYEGLKVIFRAKPVPPDQLISLTESLLPVTLTKTA